jgi:multidrug efflux system outer membrane protein
VRRTIIAAAATALIAGCTVGPDYVRPDVGLPASYPEPDVTGATLASLPADWWRLYDDPELGRLVTAGLSQGTDVQLAIARVEEARAQLREANASLFPEIDAAGVAARSGASDQTGPIRAGGVGVLNNLQIGLNTAYELDFWGRLARGREAARAQLARTEYGQSVVQISVAGAIARTYFSVRALDAQVAVSRATLRTAEDSVDITRRRSDAGIASELDVFQAEGNRAQLAAQIKELTRLRRVSVHQLGLLTGVPDLSIAPVDLLTLPTPALPPAGLPSTLLERRPDVRQAEATLEAANALIGVARAQQFPTISLTAALGVQSDNLSHLITAGAGVWSLGIGLAGPVLDWGRYAARTEAAEARARQAGIGYQQAVQTAFREVSDALSNVERAASTEGDLAVRVSQADNALRLANQRYEAGYSAYLEVLDAQRTLNDAQLALMRNRLALLTFTVDLISALGGGWQSA